MDQHPVVLAVRGKSGTDATYVEFIEAHHYFRHESAEHILEHGLTSIFKFAFVMEDISTPTMEVDEQAGRRRAL